MTTRITMSDLGVTTLGPCRIDSPLKPLIEGRKTNVHYVEEDDRVLFPDTASLVAAAGVRAEALPGFEPAGPRREIFFDPPKMRVGVVTCGGLCPGINDVIRGLVMELSFHYEVQRIVGFRNGGTQVVIKMRARAVPGFSGSPLLDDKGNLLGILVMYYPDTFEGIVQRVGIAEARTTFRKAKL